MGYDYTTAANAPDPDAVLDALLADTHDALGNALTHHLHRIALTQPAQELALPPMQRLLQRFAILGLRNDLTMAQQKARALSVGDAREDSHNLEGAITDAWVFVSDSSAMSSDPHARTLIHRLARARDRAQELAIDLRHTQRVARDLCNRLAYAFDCELIAVLAENLAPELADALIQAQSEARHMASDLHKRLELALSDTDYLAHIRWRGSDGDLDTFTQAVQHSINGIRISGRQLTGVLEYAVAQAHNVADILTPVLGQLNEAANDFRGADLHSVTLQYTPLEGIVWDDTTRWPLEWEEPIHQASERNGDGTYTIRYPEGHSVLTEC
jgi:hypothetical protein